ncbi:4-oxalocrotonate tautomerase [Mycobacterium sp. Soil538]|nr:4-oxalocrotonate tautomerase [Mycobacterium sp. Soil538]
MPFVNIKVIEGVFSAAQKQDIVRKVTDAMVEIEGENMRPVTWVVVEEVASGDWGVGGTPLHTADVKAIAAAQPIAL